MQRVSWELLEALRREPDVATFPVLLQVPWRFIGPATAAFLLWLRGNLPRLLRRLQPDLVLFTSMVTAVLVPLLRDRIAVPCVAIAHGLDVIAPFGPYQRWLRRVLKELDAVCTPSRATLAACQARGLTPEKGFVVPNGIDPARLRTVPDRTQARALLRAHGWEALDPEAPLLVSVGRWVRRKGFGWFLREVMPALPVETQYALIGDGPERGTIREAIRMLERPERIWTPGRVPEELLHTVYAAADLFVMPNVPVPGDIEGFGVVILEAALCGTPVLAAHLEGIQDAVRQPEMGWLLPAQDAPRWRAHLQTILSTRTALHELGRQARLAVQEHYSWRSLLRQHLSIWNRLLEKSAATGAKENAPAR